MRSAPARNAKPPTRPAAQVRRGRIDLGIGMSRTLATIAADRLGDAFGRSLPRTPEHLADVRVINALVEASAGSGARTLPPLERASLAGVTFPSSNCTNFLVDLECADEADDAPRTAYAKIPCRELATRAFAGALGFWKVELAFCRSLAGRMPVRVPTVYAAQERGARFVLLLENLTESPETRLFVNRDMAAGTSLERARRCLRTFAELHAAFWGLPHERRDALLPERLHFYLSPGGRSRTLALNAAAIAPAHRAAPGVFKSEHAALCRTAAGKWDAIVDRWYAEPLTLVHGDSHLANCFEYPAADGPRIGLLDFQGTHWCHGLRDVQYFLAFSLDPALLERHEDELVAFYLGELAARGVDVDVDAARRRYRGYSLQTLMVAATSLGLGALTETDATVRTVLERAVAAADRLDLRSWVERV